jgi:hypothetical protein
MFAPPGTSVPQRLRHCISFRPRSEIEARIIELRTTHPARGPIRPGGAHPLGAHILAEGRCDPGGNRGHQVTPTTDEIADTFPLTSLTMADVLSWPLLLRP